MGLENPHIKHDEREEREKKENEVEKARPPSPPGAPLTRIRARVRVLPLVSYSDELMTARTGTDYEPNRRGVRREHRSGGNARRLVSFSAVSPCDNDRVVSRLRVRRRKGGGKCEERKCELHLTLTPVYFFLSLLLFPSPRFPNSVKPRLIMPEISGRRHERGVETDRERREISEMWRRGRREVVEKE